MQSSSKLSDSNPAAINGNRVQDVMYVTFADKAADVKLDYLGGKEVPRKPLQLAACFTFFRTNDAFWHLASFVALQYVRLLLD